MAAFQIWINFGKSQIYNGDYCSPSVRVQSAFCFSVDSVKQIPKNTIKGTEDEGRNKNKWHTDLLPQAKHQNPFRGHGSCQQ